MWRPKTWADIEALIGAIGESAVLDLKREIGKGAEVAKDLAAMALNGGVLIYGIDEDKESALACGIAPLPLKQVEERLQQIAGAAIEPSLSIEVDVIRKVPDDANGIVIVVVPASPLAPHQTNHRYPARRGTTTEFLDERDVERYYRQRAALTALPAAGALLERDFVPIAGVDQTSGFGFVDMLVRPVSSEAAHPAGAWQREPLTEAVRNVSLRHGERLPGLRRVESLNALFRWEPWEAGGWRAGGFDANQSYEVPAISFGAILAYPARLSFQARWSLDVVGEGGQRRYRSARELSVAEEITSMLAIAGEYFMTVPGAAIVLVALRLRGFEGGQPESATRNRPDCAGSARGAPDGITRDLQVSALRLRNEPDILAEELIERWLPAFAAGSNSLGPMRSSGGLNVRT